MCDIWHWLQCQLLCYSYYWLFTTKRTWFRVKSSLDTFQPHSIAYTVHTSIFLRKFNQTRRPFTCFMCVCKTCAIVVDSLDRIDSSHLSIHAVLIYWAPELILSFQILKSNKQTKCEIISFAADGNCNSAECDTRTTNTLLLGAYNF